MSDVNNGTSWQRVVGQDSAVVQLPKNSECLSVSFILLIAGHLHMH